ncbi:ECF transporter S component [Erysipelothrix tonsillarum]|uniref:ECF transporter S component n=1 Tax=Erysipelothrix tonsillarum TaxID=38402 RepID=UPI00036825BF|nr:ECF transporter S component [Erysipelothrix tonsillarum]
MKKYNTRTMVKIAMLTTVSVILYMFEFFVIPGSPLQADLSDLPVIVGGYLLGTGPGLMIAFLKNLLHMFFLSKNAGPVGEFANFSYAILIMLPIALYRPKTSYKRGGLYIFAVIASALLMNVINYYVTFPLYGMGREGAWKLLFTVFFPFNLAKGMLLILLFSILRPHLHRIIGH